MIVTKNLRLKHVLFYTWRSMLYFASISVLAYVLHHEFDIETLTLPFNSVAALSTALAIFLGFNNNSAYDRWWEARKIWGLLVNYSRAWGREVLSLAFDGREAEYGVDESGASDERLEAWQKRVIYRHLAFVNALRVFLRQRHSYNGSDSEVIESNNCYSDLRKFLSEREFEEVLNKRNPPNHLLKLQGLDLLAAHRAGWLSDYRLVRLSETLTEFNNHQGMSERIKNTPFPRPYSYFSRVFVYLHGTLVPFAFIEDLGIYNIPLSLLINFIFLALDQIGERTADPFENRLDDTPLSSICLTIEENLKEMVDEHDLPVKPTPVEGVVF